MEKQILNIFSHLLSFSLDSEMFPSRKNSNSLSLHFTLSDFKGKSRYKVLLCPAQIRSQETDCVRVTNQCALRVSSCPFCLYPPNPSGSHLLSGLLLQPPNFQSPCFHSGLFQSLLKYSSQSEPRKIYLRSFTSLCSKALQWFSSAWEQVFTWARSIALIFLLYSIQHWLSGSSQNS